MLVHTKSFGAPVSEENSVIEYRNYSLINNLSLYADTRMVNVKVLEPSGKPVEKASVEYYIYNYAEFYPLIVLTTDKKGITSFETGYGDLLVWVYKEKTFDFRLVKASDTDTIFLCLNKKPFDPIATESGTINFDVELPPVKQPFPQLP